MTKALVILGTILKFVCFVDMPTGEVWGIGAQIIILDHVMKVFFSFEGVRITARVPFYRVEEHLQHYSWKTAKRSAQS